MISFDGSNLRVTLPDFSAWGFWDWALILVVMSAVYGLFTHFVSLPGIRRYNKTAEKGTELTAGKLLAALFLRMTLQLWVRIIVLCIGIIGIPVLTLATAKIRLWNESLAFACRWYYSPAMLWDQLSDEKEKTTVTITLSNGSREAKLKGDSDAVELLRNMRQS